MYIYMYKGRGEGGKKMREAQNRRTQRKVFAKPDTRKFHRIRASGAINLGLFPPSRARWPSHRALTLSDE